MGWLGFLAFACVLGWLARPKPDESYGQWCVKSLIALAMAALAVRLHQTYGPGRVLLGCVALLLILVVSIFRKKRRTAHAS